jgi:diguanylate cyclase (GGDEF)-like protein
MFWWTNDSVLAIDSNEAAVLLRNADGMKTSNPQEFKSIVDLLSNQAQSLSITQQEYLQYLQAWRTAYDGDYEGAILALNALANSSTDMTQRVRASATVANLQALASHYESAFSELSKLIALLPTVTDDAAREQILGVAAQLYNQVGEYDLGSDYADRLVAENRTGASACRGRQMKLEALYRSGRLLSVGPDVQTAIATCINAGEPSYANVIRAYAAKVLLDQGRPEDAVNLLKAHYDEVTLAKYPRLVSQYDGLLAQAYRQMGGPALARQFANRAVQHAVKNEYTEPLVNAYRLLYLLAKEQGDATAALTYHEKYAAADKGYLDDVSARQLAYQRTKHQVDADKLKIETLNKQNEVLHLQGSLADKAVETSRLYIVMLVMGLAFVVFMAYRTKRSQMHFMNLSRLDGLTGLTNRPHFLELAEHALYESKRSGQSICVIICDLDYFKRINDSCGHAAGDTALKRTAAVFEAHLRKLDIVGRLGGEEFGIVLIDCDAATALVRCDEIRLAIAKISISDGTTEFELAASLGIATTVLSGHELRKLLADADAALYEAKRTGRNRVVQHGIERVSQESQPPDILNQLSA